MVAFSTVLAVLIPSLVGLFGALFKPKDHRRLASQDIGIIHELESLRDVPDDALHLAKKQLISDLQSLTDQGSKKIGRTTYWALMMSVGVVASLLCAYVVEGVVLGDWSGRSILLSAVVYGVVLVFWWITVFARKLSSLSE